MRLPVKILLFILTLTLVIVAQAEPKSPEAFSKELQTLTVEIKKLSFEQKKSKVLNFKKDLEKTMADYEKLSPEIASAKESKVIHLNSTLTPIFDWLETNKTFSRASCHTTRLTLKTRANKDKTPDPETDWALKLMNEFCTE